VSAAAAIKPENVETDEEASEFWWREVALEGAAHELDDVLEFLRRHERDQVLGIATPSLADLIDALERGEHRR